MQSQLDEILLGVSDMKSLLKLEEAVLADRNAPKLQKISENKEELAKRINQSTASLFSNLARLGISASNQISSAFEKMGEPGKTLNATWQQIAALAKECEELNDLNGAYVGLLRQHVQRSLDALHDRPSQNLTYGPDGVGQRPTSTRKLLSV